MTQNTSNNLFSNPLENSTNEAKKYLARIDKIFSCDKAIELFANSFCIEVVDQSQSILFARMEKNWKTKVSKIVATEIVRACDGNIWVPNYIPSKKAEQKVLIFIGTHWEKFERQPYYDFINECSQRAGLDEELLYDPSYMHRIYHQVAFLVSHQQKNMIPPGEAWLNLKNGTLEIHENGEIIQREHRREDNLTYVIPYVYDSNATCEKWKTFLNEVLPDVDTQNVLAQYIGYCFTRNLNLEKMLVLHGSGSNGKSVALTIVEAILGSHNVSNINLSDLTKDHEKRSHTEGKLANISHENRSNIAFDALKSLISGEATLIRTLYVGSKTITNYGKLFASFNILPSPENTYGWFRRWMLIPFNVTIDEERVDTDLAEKLKQELPGILNWVLEATKVLLKDRRFSESQECKNALLEYKKSGDNVLMFLSERCEMNCSSYTNGKDLLSAYRCYCHDEEESIILGKRRFFNRLREITNVKEDTSQGASRFNIRVSYNG